MIIKYPDKRLLKVSEPVNTLKEAHAVIEKLIAAIKEDIDWGEVVGLAAPQVGVNKRVFLANSRAYINPEILWTPKGGEKLYEEGCYSLEKENYSYVVKRPYAVKVRYTDVDGNEITERLNGDKAQVVLHEFDHLEGRLCNG